jgi:hypothetical protein
MIRGQMLPLRPPSRTKRNGRRAARLSHMLPGDENSFAGELPPNSATESPLPRPDTPPGRPPDENVWLRILVDYHTNKRAVSLPIAAKLSALPGVAPMPLERNTTDSRDPRRGGRSPRPRTREEKSSRRSRRVPATLLCAPSRTLPPAVPPESEYCNSIQGRDIAG